MRKSYLSNVAVKVLLSFLCVLAIFFEAGAQTYTIGGPAGPNNFASFNAAYNAIRTGITQPVIFNVAPGSGPYNEQLIIKTIPGASATNRVTFNCNGVEIGTAATATGQRAIIKLDSASFVTFDSLTIKADAGTFGYGVQLLRNSNFNVFSRCTIITSKTSTSQNYAGIVINTVDGGPIGTSGRSVCDDNLFIGNKITGGYYGVLNSGINPGGTNGRNRFIKNIVSDFYQYGFYFSGTYNSLIDSNVISRPTRTAVGPFYGVHFGGSLNQADTVSRNFIIRPFDSATNVNQDFYGINFENTLAIAGFENIVQNNVISASYGTGRAYGISNNVAPNTTYYHNTISIENEFATTASAVRGASFTGTADNIVFYDNLISVYRGGTGTKHCFYTSNSSTTLIADYNNYFVSGNGSNNFIGFKSTNYATLGAWRATGYDLTSTSVDPAYVDTANENYRPQNAAFDNKGLYVLVDFDIYNAARSTTAPDMGAIEFVPPPCTAPPTAGITVFNSFTLVDTTVCEGVLMPLNLRGNSFGGSQTYDWQTSVNGTSGWTSVSGPLSFPDYVLTATSTVFIRAAVTCGTSTVYSNTLKLTVIPALPQGTYTIHPTTGNYASFNAAKTAMACGISGSVVFNVVPASGPYNEQLVLGNIPRINSFLDSIKFVGNGESIVFSSTDAAEKAVIKLNSSRLVIFDSLVIDSRGTGTQGVGIQLINNSDSNTVRRCTIISDTSSTGNTFAPVVVNGSATGLLTTGPSLCDFNTFDGNRIRGGFSGIVALSSNSTVNNGNVFSNNIITDFFNYGVYLGSGNAGTVVRNNRITRPTRFNVSGNVYGIFMTGAGSAATLISENRIYNLLGANPASNVTTYGIAHSSANGATGNYHRVINNLLFQFTGSGPVYGLSNSGSTYLQYYHNTVAIESFGTNPSGLSRAFNQSGVVTGTLFKNNMLTISRDGNGVKHVIYLTTPADVETDFNNFAITSTGGTSNFIGFSGSNRLDLAAWQAATTQDANSLSFDPGYKNPAIEDYSPVVSPLDNKGTPLNILTDVNGAARSTTTPDIGAIEFSVPTCTPPTVTTATVNPSSGICVSVPITLDIPGAVSATGLTYIWFNGPSATGPWTRISDSLFFPKFNTLSYPNSFYQAQIVCNGTVYFSTVVQINMNQLLLGGTYTINSANPTNYPTGTNFTSFNDAITAMNCGITGPVIFNVSANTYNEQAVIRKVPGLGIVSGGIRNTVTFQSGNGNAATSILTFAPTSATSNYVVKIDSARYVTFRNLTLSNTSTSTGRVVDISGTSGFDTIQNCIVTTPATTSTNNTSAAIYSAGVSNLYIKGNTITNGSSGIYLAGTSTNLTTNIIIDSNNVTGAFVYGVYAGFSKRVQVSRNTVSVSSPAATTAYGLYTTDCDTAYRIIGNNVNISNVISGSVNGVFTVNSETPLTDSGIIASNTIIGGTGNTCNIYGLVNNNSAGAYTVNNVIAITTAGPTSQVYGLHSFVSNATGNNLIYYNNSINITVPVDTNTYAAYFNHVATASNVKIRNNIFSNKGVGKALYINNFSYFSADYNNLYTVSNRLVQSGTPNARYSSIAAWRAASNWDVNSIVYPPAFVSATDLHPDLTSPDVWAIHGRGVQIRENTYDFDNQPRPTTLIAGVPDLGAYEFLPTSVPTLLSAIPSAVPAPNTTQTFVYGSDTVMRIYWGTDVPSSIGIRRYSGVRPVNLPSSLDSMYFYTKVEVPSGSILKADTVEQIYIDPWQGSISDQYRIGMGRTTNGGAWIVGFNSLVDVDKKSIIQPNIDYLDKFTGLVNPYAPIQGPEIDSSNEGKRFWVAYPVNQLSGGQDMVLYLSARKATRVRVTINGTSPLRFWDYNIPANNVRVSAIIPKTGPDNAFINTPGLSDRGISIQSFDNPIVAYSHVYGSASSGAGMLLPVGVWGYEYQTLGITQDYGLSSYAYYYVIADNDNTVVEITSTPGIALQPTTPTITPGVPTRVTLNKGEFFQVVASSQTEELSGSIIKAVQNSDGKCFPFAVYCGSSRTAIDCPSSGGSGGDFIMQQVFPYQAWGQRFLTAPSSSSDAANSLQPNVFRVAVRDPATQVFRNGTLLTGLASGNYYEYTSSTADYIEANKPIMVAQFLTGACSGVGDPEMMYISPIEQGIKKVAFYRNTVQAITTNYLTMIVPTAAVPSVRLLEGTVGTPSTFTYVYPHPRNGAPYLRGVNYTVMVKRWTSAQQQVRVESDSAFTGITYGLGSVESYGYNAGTLVKSINGAIDTLINKPPGDTAYPGAKYTCAKTPFSFTVLFPLVPDSIRFSFSAVPSRPNTDVVLNPAVPNDTIIINGAPYYSFTVPQTITFDLPGVYGIPVKYSHPSIEACDKTKTQVIYLQVTPEPKPTFGVNTPVCAGDTTFYLADSLTENALKIAKWTWKFSDGTIVTPNVLNPFKVYAPGVYFDTLRTITADGCIGDTVRRVEVTPKPTVDVIQDTIIVCYDSTATFIVQNPVAGATYNWYDSATGVVPVAVGDTLIVANVTGPKTFYVEAITGCKSLRKLVTALVQPGLPQPVPVVSNIGASSITWTWPAIAGAVGYMVNVDNTGWVVPSSGATGLTHVQGGLAPQQQSCIQVMAVGATACLTSVSASVCGTIGCPNVTLTASPVDTTVCVGQSVTFSASASDPSYTFNWYDVPTGGTILATGSTLPVTATATANYYVEAVNGGCVVGRFTVKVTTANILAAPVVSSRPPAPTPSSITFSWPAVAGATGYEVNDGLGGGWQPVGNVLTHTVSGLQPLQVVTLQVRAVGPLACQTSPDGLATDSTPCANALPIQLQSDTLRGCAGSSVTFTVTNPTGASVGYTWLDGTQTPISGANGPTLNVTVGTAPSTYYVDATLGGCSFVRKQGYVIPYDVLVTPVINRIDSTLTSLTFFWNAVPGATGYEVSTDGITFSAVGNVTSYPVSPLNPGQTYTLYVRAVTSIACQTSPALQMIGTTKVCAVLAVPAVTVSDSSQSSVTFSWPAVAGAQGYIVNGSINLPATTTTYVVSGLTPGQSASITVVAVAGAPCSNSAAGTGTGNAKVCVTLAVPNVSAIDSTQSSVTFSWPAVAGAQGYIVNGSINLPATTTTYTVTGLTPGQSTSITVVAVAAAPCPNSAQGSATGTSKGCLALPAPVRVAAIDSTSSTVTFSWPAVAGASAYRVEVQIGGATTWTVLVASQTTTTVTVTGLASTQNVRIRVFTLGGQACENSLTSTTGIGNAALDQVYIPNAFTPNGSGNPENERLRVYSNVIKEGRFMIYNQWGQKIYEANTIADMKQGWDGTFSGKAQPVGVYIYVGRFTLTNGSVIDKKGSINLVR